jgi:hypothetical protein
MLAIPRASYIADGYNNGLTRSCRRISHFSFTKPLFNFVTAVDHPSAQSKTFRSGAQVPPVPDG